MGDKRALQAGTSHNLGQNFAKAFEVTFQNKNNNEELVYATSWGISTRLVGGVIMTHGDDKGLQLPPKIAPYQVVLVPIFRDDDDKKNIQDYLRETLIEMQKLGIRVHEDWRKGSPGFKFTVSSYDEFKDILSNKGGFIKCGWDGTSETEAAIKNETKATIRVIPMDENPKGLNCIYSGKPAKHEVIFAKAY